MITTLRFGQENGHPKVEAAAVLENDETILELKYGPASTLWRVNLGWRRRQYKTVYGFSIDANTGEWTKDDQAPTDAEDDQVADGKSIEKVTPFVEDTRNVLIIQPTVDLSEKAIVSLQYALKRGIEQEYQLEEVELAAEPLPDRDTRNAILLYEAAEGGAGVLTRLATDPDAIPRIARRALEVCHFSSKSGRWDSIADLKDEEQECEAGCYRCLLSYYNQLDHQWIDRQDSEMIELLCRLARGQRTSLEAPPQCRRQFRGNDECIQFQPRTGVAQLSQNKRLPPAGQSAALPPGTRHTTGFCLFRPPDLGLYRRPAPQRADTQRA